MEGRRMEERLVRKSKMVIKLKVITQTDTPLHTAGKTALASDVVIAG